VGDAPFDDLLRLAGGFHPAADAVVDDALDIVDGVQVGVGHLADVERLSAGRVDLTIGSALDLFGGTGVRYADCVAWNRRPPPGARSRN
ncbi:MAG: hypothetical protein ACO3DQ_03805, partial [Cephaloticoccus sp.]